MVPAIRITRLNTRPVQEDGRFVLHWMTAYRRTRSNFALQRSVEWARELAKPLFVFDPLRAGYPWASDRFHSFVLDGMQDNARRLEASGVTYYPYVEETADAGKGLLEYLGSEACVVVADAFPGFFMPRMRAAAAKRLPVLLEEVDSNGLLPIRASDRAYATAFAFRRHMQQELPGHLQAAPAPDPLAGLRLPLLAELPSELRVRWPRVSPKRLASRAWVEKLPIDHSVPPIAGARGGQEAAHETLSCFLSESLHSYGDGRNHPDREVTSRLSPYLHFGHVSAHDIFRAVMETEGWEPSRLSKAASGKRQGWWGVDAGAEAFLDQVTTWRELGLNAASMMPAYDHYESLPTWARETLEQHASDPRTHLYDVEELKQARTHDPVWNAAQRQLLTDGRIHNYLRMLWGKRILGWSPTPASALERMIDLNNRYALDGRDPNSYSGIFWCLGRYDRPWGPERPVFGKVRYMTSQNTARKLRLKEYLERYAGEDDAGDERGAPDA